MGISKIQEHVEGCHEDALEGVAGPEGREGG